MKEFNTYSTADGKAELINAKPRSHERWESDSDRKATTQTSSMRGKTPCVSPRTVSAHAPYGFLRKAETDSRGSGGPGTAHIAQS